MSNISHKMTKTLLANAKQMTVLTYFLPPSIPSDILTQNPKLAAAPTAANANPAPAVAPTAAAEKFNCKCRLELTANTAYQISTCSLWFITVASYQVQLRNVHGHLSSIQGACNCVVSSANSNNMKQLICSGVL